MNIWSSLAATVLIATFCVHVFIGGKYVARPLLDDTGLPRAARWLSYYCWHLVSLMIAAMALLSGLAPFFGLPNLVTAALACFCAVCSIMSAVVAWKGGIHPLRFPSTTLFALAAVVLGIAFLSIH